MSNKTAIRRAALMFTKVDKKRVIVQRNSPFGQRIADFRKAAGHTQHSLAAACGFHRSKVAMIETGRALITLPDFVVLCRVLKTTPNEVLEFDQ